jgi:hypothetical protein
MCINLLGLIIVSHLVSTSVGMLQWDSMVARWRGKETCCLSHRGGSVCLSVVLALISSGVGVEISEWRGVRELGDPFPGVVLPVIGQAHSLGRGTSCDHVLRSRNFSGPRLVTCVLTWRFLPLARGRCFIGIVFSAPIFVSISKYIFMYNFWILSYYAHIHLWWISHDFRVVGNNYSWFMLKF